jgi:hypothetical protein
LLVEAKLRKQAENKFESTLLKIGDLVYTLKSSDS